MSMKSAVIMNMNVLLVCSALLYTMHTWSSVILPISLAVLPGVKVTPDSFRNWTKTESGQESCTEDFVGRPLLLVFFDSVQMKTHQYSQAIHLFNYAKRTMNLSNSRFILDVTTSGSYLECQVWNLRPLWRRSASSYASSQFRPESNYKITDDTC